jgi:hypothetical protein
MNFHGRLPEQSRNPYDAGYVNGRLECGMSMTTHHFIHNTSVTWHETLWQENPKFQCQNRRPKCRGSIKRAHTYLCVYVRASAMCTVTAPANGAWRARKNFGLPTASKPLPPNCRFTPRSSRSLQKLPLCREKFSSRLTQSTPPWQAWRREE